MEYKFRKYLDTDYEFVYNLKKLCYKKYVEEYFGPWDDNVQRKMFNDLMQKDAAHTLIILVDGKEIGFFSEDPNCDGGAYRPNNLCLLPEYQGKGIGTDILTNVFEKHKNQTIILRVFKSNPAQNLYKRLGFEVYEETNTHYLMKKSESEIVK